MTMLLDTDRELTALDKTAILMGSHNTECRKFGLPLPALDKKDNLIGASE